MIVYGFDAVKLAAVKTLGDLIPLLPDNKKLYWLGNAGSGHYFKGISKKRLLTLPDNWKISSLDEATIIFDTNQDDFEAGCGKILEDMGWRKDQYGFYSIRVK